MFWAKELSCFIVFRGVSGVIGLNMFFGESLSPPSNLARSLHGTVSGNTVLAVHGSKPHFGRTCFCHGFVKPSSAYLCMLVKSSSCMLPRLVKTTTGAMIRETMLAEICKCNLDPSPGMIRSHLGLGLWVIMRRLLAFDLVKRLRGFLQRCHLDT